MAYMREKLTDYDLYEINFYVIDSTTSVSREELNGQDLASMGSDDRYRRKEL